MKKERGCYLNPKYTSTISPGEVNTIFEIGSRDALDAIDLHKHFNCKVFCFECNPVAIDICQKNLEDYSNDQIELVPKAVFNKNDTLDFFPVTKTSGKDNPNIGCSSFFKYNPQFELKKYKHVDHHHQGEPIKVDAVRLETFMNEKQIPQVDLICMDLQGAELMALEGLGKYLSKAKYIITELCTPPIEVYGGQGKFHDVFKLLENHGFKHISGNPQKLYQDDFFFVRK